MNPVDGVVQVLIQVLQANQSNRTSSMLVVVSKHADITATLLHMLSGSEPWRFKPIELGKGRAQERFERCA